MIRGFNGGEVILGNNIVGFYDGGQVLLVNLIVSG